MRTETLASLSNDDVRVVRSVEQKIVEALSRIANRVSVQGLAQAVTQIVEATERYVARLDRRPSAIDADRPMGASRGAPLTSREVEVLRLIAEGFANKQIAAELAISIKTVEKHRQNMMAKLDLHDTAGVTRYAIAMGVVRLPV